ncbi:B12-binding domain-containing protein [Bacillus sp. 1P06AnD]|uniref:cobalamin B12-binding domain-containing protein n=1 Tax=Bacillus sp. 1P06AnD TaxID=3132208 RepID=UPI00399F4BE2
MTAINPQEFAQILLSGDQDKAFDAIVKGRPMKIIDICEKIITPALRHIGLLWEQNKISVADEHVATAICDYILTRFHPDQLQKNEKKALVLCLEGENHYIGAKMASLLFVENGWKTRYMGPNMPINYLLDYANQLEPDVICLSVTMAYHLPSLPSYISSLSLLPSTPSIIIGGRLSHMLDLNGYGLEPGHVVEDLYQLEEWISNQTAGVRLNV